MTDEQKQGERSELVVTSDETGKEVFEYLQAKLKLPKFMTRLTVTFAANEAVTISADFLAEKRTDPEGEE